MTQPDIPTLSYLDPKVVKLLPEVVENRPVNANVSDQLAYYREEMDQAQKAIRHSTSPAFNLLSCATVFLVASCLYSSGYRDGRGEELDYHRLAGTAAFGVAALVARQFEKVGAKRSYLAAHYLYTKERMICSPVMANALKPSNGELPESSMILRWGISKGDLEILPDSLFRFRPHEVEALGDFRNQILSLKPSKKVAKTSFSA